MPSWSILAQRSDAQFRADEGKGSRSRKSWNGKPSFQVPRPKRAKSQTNWICCHLGGPDAVSEKEPNHLRFPPSSLLTWAFGWVLYCQAKTFICFNLIIQYNYFVFDILLKFKLNKMEILLSIPGRHSSLKCLFFVQSGQPGPICVFLAFFLLSTHTSQAGPRHSDR